MAASSKGGEGGTEAHRSLDRRASPAQGLDGELWRRGGAVVADRSMRRSSGLQFPRAGALVGCGPREAVSEVKKPTAGLNRGENLTYRRWVSGENQENGAVQGLRRWPTWLLDPRRAAAVTCGDGSVVGRPDHASAVRQFRLWERGGEAGVWGWLRMEARVTGCGAPFIEQLR